MKILSQFYKMPLLLICGPPGSGKSVRAKELAAYFEEAHKMQICLINEEELKIIKNEGYQDSLSEKMTRGQLKSNAEKMLSQERVVIFDSMNYIKGYRYELFCIARAVKTTNCVLYCNSPYEVCKENNSKSENGFTSELFEDLFKRMEVPKQKDRWDSPYFEVRHNEKTPFEEIAEVLLFQDKKARDPTATKIDQKHEINFVQEMDKKIQDVIDAIMVQQSEAISSMNGIVRFTDSKVQLQLARILSLIELKKLKMEFQSMVRINPLKSSSQVTDAFVQFLQAQVQRL